LARKFAPGPNKEATLASVDPLEAH
jgi:hypothetical protein